MKQCDVTTVFFKRMKKKMREEPRVWRRVSHSSAELNTTQTLWVNAEWYTDPNDTSAIIQNVPYINTDTLCLPN